MNKNIKYNDQIKSLKRVSSHGEVYTRQKEVGEMLSLFDHETTRIDSRFLEPACGNGNFLFEIMLRKLKIISSLHKKNTRAYERYVFIAASNLYGIDILEDNVQEAIERIFKLIESNYLKDIKKINTNFLSCIKYVLSKNIVQGDALTYKSYKTGKPISLIEWSFINETKLLRREYLFSDLLAYQPIKEPNLFSSMGDKAFVPPVIKEYKVIKFLDIANEE